MNWRRAAIGSMLAIPVVGLLAYGLTQNPREIRSPLPGREAPQFALATMDGGQTVSLAEHRGNIVVVNFWASWCLPCRAEHGALSEVATAYHPKGVRFYGILYDDLVSNAREFIQQMGGQSYPTLLDPRKRTAIDFGLYGVPETFFIDANGVVFEKSILPVTSEYLRQTLDRMLAVPATRPTD
jgi:cytochrome c biogenesis protein CcmG, thiol:disulfide interchange protein DsbE